MKKRFHFRTIQLRILIPMLILTLIQSIILVLILYFGVARTTLNEALINNFESNVNIRKNYMESSMYNKWSNLEYVYDSIISNTKDYLDDNNITINEVLEDTNNRKKLLMYQADLISDIIMRNHVTNSFIILNSNDENKDMIFLRTMSPTKENIKEIEVLAAPFDVIKHYYSQGCLMNSNVYEFKYSDLNNFDFFRKPIENTRLISSSEKREYGIWNSDLIIEESRLLTYSIPLFFENNVIGVVGIGLTRNYLQSSMYQINKGDNLNIGLIRKYNNEIQNVFSAYLDYSIPEISDINLEKTDFTNIYSFDNNGTIEYYYEEELKLYNDNENNNSEGWYIVGIIPMNVLFSASKLAINQVMLIYIISFVAINLIIFLITIFIIRPIRKVSRSINEENILDIPKTKIYEVDVLLSKLSIYFEKNLEINNKINRLIEDTNMNIALAEYSIEDNIVNTTSKFYSMLGINYEGTTVMLGEFKLKVLNIFDNIISSTISMKDIENNIFSVSGEFLLNINDNFIQFKTNVSSKGCVITLIDLTDEYKEKKKIEYERDYDVLTGLLNRRGFSLKVESLIKRNNPGALYMIDIDNLKMINDDYGHDFGDEYINIVGNYLLDIHKKYANLYASHISGDEYILYLDNPINNQIEEIGEEISNIKDIYFEAYTKRIYVSLSCGIAISNGELSLSELKKRADFTMYTVKKSGKNKIAYFDNNAYKQYINENSLHDKLIQLINDKCIDYAYQPIVDIHTGEVLGFEALMRPTIDEFKSPIDVIDYAKKYNRLYDIEKLTIFTALEKFVKSNINKKVFINSISSQQLSESDLSIIIEKYKDYFNNIVIEIIEEDFGETDILKSKTSSLKNLNINYAIDDYGTGFNNIGMILNYSPKYIKLDCLLVREINIDNKKLMFAKSLIEFCKKNNILVIAEGVETIEELKCVKEAGADYVQGYLIAKPNLEIKDIPLEIKKLIIES